MDTREIIHIRGLAKEIYQVVMKYIKEHYVDIKDLDKEHNNIPNVLLSAHLTAVFNMMRYLASSSEEALREVDEFIESYSEHIKNYPGVMSFTKGVDEKGLH